MAPMGCESWNQMLTPDCELESASSVGSEGGGPGGSGHLPLAAPFTAPQRAAGAPAQSVVPQQNKGVQ